MILILLLVFGKFPVIIKCLRSRYIHFDNRCTAKGETWLEEYPVFFLAAPKIISFAPVGWEHPLGSTWYFVF